MKKDCEKLKSEILIIADELNRMLESNELNSSKVIFLSQKIDALITRYYKENNTISCSECVDIPRE